MRARVLVLFAILLAPFAFGAAPQYIPIAVARATPVGSTVTVLGLVSVPSGTLTSSSDPGFAMQDQTAGIWVSTKEDLHFKEGQRVLVTGVLVRTVNELQLTQTQITPLSGKELRVATGQVGDATSGFIISVQGTITRTKDDGQYGYKLWINDGSGEVQIFIAKSTNIHPTAPQLQPGKAIRVTGFSTVYETTWEVEPRSRRDIRAARAE